MCPKLQVYYALTLAAFGITQSSSLAPDASKAKSSAASIFAILDRKSKIDSSDAFGMKIENVKGEIELQHISFRYPTRPDVQIFRDLCLAIHSGKVTCSDLASLVILVLYIMAGLADGLKNLVSL